MNKEKPLTLFAIENGSYELDVSVPCIVSSCRGFIPSHEFRAYLKKGLALIKENIKEHGKLGWIPDLIHSDVFDLNDMQWLTDYWNPRAYQAGIRYIAFVMSKSVIVQLNVMEYTALTGEDGSLLIGYFDNVESAKEWLREALNDQE